MRQQACSDHLSSSMSSELHLRFSVSRSCMASLPVFLPLSLFLPLIHSSDRSAACNLSSSADSLCRIAQAGLWLPTVLSLLMRFSNGGPLPACCLVAISLKEKTHTHTSSSQCDAQSNLHQHRLQGLCL